MGLVVRSPAANAGDVRDAGSIPGSGRSPGGGHGNPLQYSCLGNPMYRGPGGLQSTGLQPKGLSIWHSKFYLQPGPFLLTLPELLPTCHLHLMSIWLLKPKQNNKPRLHTCSPWSLLHLQCPTNHSFNCSWFLFPSHLIPHPSLNLVGWTSKMCSESDPSHCLHWYCLVQVPSSLSWTSLFIL